MQDDATRIIRSTIAWGAGAIFLSAILSARGAPIEPRAVAVGVVYAVIAVKFYAVVVAALFREHRSLASFGVWFPIKLAMIIGFLIFAARRGTVDLLSLIGGSLVFIPAAFRYAIEESKKPLPDEGVLMPREGSPSDPADTPPSAPV